MRFSETFVVEAAPEVVFDYMTDPANLRDWQTSKTSVAQLTDGPPGLGPRIREPTKPPGAEEFEQIVEFEPMLQHMTTPTRVIWGAHDAWLAPDVSARIASWLPRADRLVIPDAGHFSSPEDQPVAVAHALSDFLTTSERTWL